MIREAQNGSTHKSHIGLFPSLELTNKIFLNMKNLKFKNVSKKWGFRGKGVTQGLAVADFDRDGDLDLVMNRLNQKAVIYEMKRQHLE